MLLFNQNDGELIGIFLDGGYLTNVRTAAAGAVVARCMAPEKVDCIGILGAGIQGHCGGDFLAQ
jgi:ornithine cyclodeaminase